MPEIGNIVKILRNSPCREGCDYCRKALDIHRGLREIFGFSDLERLKGLQGRGYALHAAEARFVVAWRDKQDKAMTEPTAVLLPNVYLRRQSIKRRTFFRWFEHCFHEDKIPGDWRSLLNNASLPEVGDMYALQVQEWEKQVAAKAVLQKQREMEKERREMAKKQRDTLRQIVRAKFGMSLPRWLSGEKDMDRLQRLIIAASCAQDAAAFQTRLEQERGETAA